MSDILPVDRSADRDVTRSPNVVDVGAWLACAKTLPHGEFADYVPRHRAAALAA